MNINTVIEAEKQAKEFLRRAKTLKDRAKDDKFAWYGCKESGSVKRQSLELSNALIELRKP